MALTLSAKLENVTLNKLMRAISMHVKILDWEVGLTHLGRRLSYKLMDRSLWVEAIEGSIRSFSGEEASPSGGGGLSGGGVMRC